MATTIAVKANVNKKEIIGWMISILIPICILGIPTNEVLTPEIKRFLAITSCAILMFAFELMDNVIPSLLLPVGYVLLDIAPSSVAFSPWLSDLPWMIIGALIIVNVAERVNLLKRIAYLTLYKVGGSYRGIIYGIGIIGIILNICLSGTMFVTIGTLAYGICLALKLGKSKAATGIMLAAAVAGTVPAFSIYNPAVFGAMMGIITPAFGIEVTWVQYLIHHLIFLPMTFILLFVIEKMFKPDVEFQGKEYFLQEYKNLGKMSIEEKKTVIVVLGVILYLVTAGWHKLGMGWGFLFAACILYFPGFKVGGKQDIERVNLSLVIFMTACMAIGQVSTSLNMGNIISNIVLPIFQNVSPVIFILCAWILAVLLNLLLTPLAAIAAFAVPLVQIALDMGINPYPVMYGFYQGLDQVILPYEFFNYLFCFSFALISTKDFVKFFGVKMLIGFVYVAVLAVPYWKLIGIL